MEIRILSEEEIKILNDAREKIIVTITDTEIKDTYEGRVLTSQKLFDTIPFIAKYLSMNEDLLMLAESCVITARNEFVKRRK